MADRSAATITIVNSFIINIIIIITIVIIIKIIIMTGYSWQRRLTLADRSPGTITGCLDSTSTRHRRTFQHTSSSFENDGLKSSVFFPVRIIYSFYMDCAFLRVHSFLNYFDKYQYTRSSKKHLKRRQICRYISTFAQW